MIVTICVALITLVIIMDVLLVVFFKMNFKNYSRQVKHWPKVSVIVAARNEERFIEGCINSLLNQDYPGPGLEILIGDDGSTDSTFNLAAHLAKCHDHLYAIKINERKRTGKINALAQLADRANGELLLFTDADIKVGTSWVRAMVEAYYSGNNIGVVTGVTATANNIYQHLDWMFALGMIKAISDLGQPVTAMGNNMLVSRKAYDHAGGFDGIPFSITEDYEIFKQIRKKGYNTLQLFTHKVLAHTYPQPDLPALLVQRKRWIKGAAQLPFSVLTLLFLQAVYYPAIVILLFLNFPMGLALLIVKIILQSLFIFLIHRKLDIQLNWLKLPVFEGYLGLMSVLSVLFYLKPGKINWKGREY